MHPDDIDLTADGPHAYLARAGDHSVRITVAPETLVELGLGAAEEPLLVRRALEQLPPGALNRAGPETTLADLGAGIPGYPELVVARLRS